MFVQLAVLGIEQEKLFVGFADVKNGGNGLFHCQKKRKRGKKWPDGYAGTSQYRP
jgi:hypothetical protein